MVFNSIKVYARLKKEQKVKEKWYDIIRRNQICEDLVFYKRSTEDYISSKFRFYQVFDQDFDQSIIFETVAKPVVSSVLQGFNGTIFAYGQTGSGKTYTMTGSTKKYLDRGIVPRSLQFIFSSIEKTEDKPILYISYMEIYNEICFDLLNPKGSKIASCLEELPRVAVFEDKKGQARLRNLSVVPVSTEEEAMRLLFLGDTNRVIAETPLNEYSSRSHCIFTIYISSRSSDTHTLRHSKLNLVDLAGSERVYKSNITGSILNEAKHINLSLHFLQQVFLALSESKRPHIPYRNSLLTFILKDSLAGNCLTAMLATLAVSKENLPETISTCKFAQRVSMIKTEPVINEVSDPYQEISILKNEIQELRNQLANSNISVIGLQKQLLTNTQKEECERKIEQYLKNPEENCKIELDMNKIQHCFSLLKNKIQTLEHQTAEIVQHSSQLNSTCCSKKLPRDQKNTRYLAKNALNSCCCDIGYNNIDDTSIKLKDSCFRGSVKDCDSTDLKPNKSLTSSWEDDNLLKEFMTNPQNCEEIEYYTNTLFSTYEKAKILGLTIEECQTTISYVREKLDVIAQAGCGKKKNSLGRELEYQQNIYRRSLGELKELQHETMQLEAGLKKAKARMIQRFKEWTTSKKKCKQIYFEGDRSASKVNSIRFNFGKARNIDLDVQQLQYQPCQCNISDDQLEFVTRRKYSHSSKLGKLPEHTSKCSCDSHLECSYEDFNTAPDNSSILELQELEKPRGGISVGGFLPEIINPNSEIERSECTFYGKYPQVRKALNPGCCIKIDEKSTRYSDACFRGSVKGCDRTKSYYEEESCPNNSTRSNFSYDFVTSTNDHFKSNIQCPCNTYYKDFLFKSDNCLLKNYQHFQGTTKDFKVCQTEFGHLGDDEYSLSRENCKNFYSTVEDSKIKRCLKGDLPVANLNFSDTQLVPNKLDKNFTAITENRQPAIVKSEDNKTKTISSPSCQETICNYEIDLNNDNVKKKHSTEEPVSRKYNIIEDKNEEQRNSQYNGYDIFLETDTDEFRKFMENISLTGDEEIDKEICIFYRSKVRS